MKTTKKPKFVYVTCINTTPKKLWRALTKTDFIREYWMGRENTSTWKRGAVLESHTPEGELEWRGKILESKPPQRLIYTFQMDGPKQPVSRVTFEIETLDKKTMYSGKAVMLTVTHEGYNPSSPQFKGISSGWPVILSGLKTLLETGKSLGIKYDC